MRTPGNPFALQLFVALLCELARAVSYACMAHSHEPCRPWSFQHEPWQAHFPEEGAVACWGRNPVSAKGVVHSQQTAFRATPHLSRALPERASLTGLWPWRWFFFCPSTSRVADLSAANCSHHLFPYLPCLPLHEQHEAGLRVTLLFVL